MRFAFGALVGGAAVALFSIWTIRGRGLPTMAWDAAAKKFFMGCRCGGSSIEALAAAAQAEQLPFRGMQPLGGLTS